MSRPIKFSTLLIVFSLLCAAVSPARALPLDFSPYSPPIHPGVDFDKDGLPDQDELLFGSSTIKTDADGDKFDDLAEFIAGSNPRDPLSFPVVGFVHLRNHQYLKGQNLLLRPDPLTPVWTSNLTYTTNITVDGVDVETNITIVFTNYPTYLWYHDGEPLTYDITNRIFDHTEVVTNDDGTFTTNSIYRTNYIGTKLVENQLSLFIQNLTTNDSGLYYQVASVPVPFGKPVTVNQQITRTLEIEVLDALPKVKITQPVGSLTNYGDNSYLQASGFTNGAGGDDIASFAIGLSHGVAVRANGSVVVWGTNGNNQLNAPPITNAVQVSAGGFHSLALLANGTVVGWGDNAYGQSTVPAGLTNVISVACGYVHSLALRADGTVVGWGRNTSGECNIPGGTGKVVSIAAGLAHSAAVLADGSIVCWGLNLDGQCDVPDLQAAAGSVSCGFYHTVALLRDGRIVRWGNNDLGQVSAPFQSTLGTPQTTLTHAVKIVAGDFYTVLLDTYGRIAVSGYTKAPVVTAVGAGKTNGVAYIGPGFSNIAAGYGTLFALKPASDLDADSLSDVFEAAKATVSTFADTDNDGLEDGIELLLGTDPLNPDTDGDGLGDYYEVTHYFDPNSPLEAADSSLDVKLIYGLRTFAVLAGQYQLQASTDGVDWIDVGNPTDRPAGFVTNFFEAFNGERYFRTLSVLPPPTSGEGGPVYGTLLEAGFLTAAQRAVPAVAQGIVAISSGFSHDLALQTDGTVVAWGENASGQATLPAGLANVREISAGGAHSLAVLADGSIVGWGSNRSGQTNAPAIHASKVAAGLNHSLALSTENKVYAWGDNSFGQTSIPAGLSTAKAIAAGFSHSLAITESGQVFAWGDNRFGQCDVPAGLPPVMAVAGGYGHSLALLTDGTVRAWGINTNGEIAVPAGLSHVVAIAAGASHSAALKDDGKVVIWGTAIALQEPIPSTFTGINLLAAGGSRTLVAKLPVDSDNDGLDDSFELAAGTDPNNPSTTGDGYLDGWKYLHGFNLLEPIIAPDGKTDVLPAVKLTLFTLTGNNYQLRSTTDFVTWRNEGPQIVGNNGRSIKNFHGDGDHRFYQLRPVTP
ncbi:MAG TPA: hypothetical protein VMF06_04235 [Candidatus Limnocylindria bacterium]|nr:hypothetical protein [Candidatus Limnocylindria bacterium]